MLLLAKFATVKFCFSLQWSLKATTLASRRLEAFYECRADGGYHVQNSVSFCVEFEDYRNFVCLKCNAHINMYTFNVRILHNAFIMRKLCPSVGCWPRNCNRFPNSILLQLLNLHFISDLHMQCIHACMCICMCMCAQLVDMLRNYGQLQFVNHVGNEIFVLRKLFNLQFTTVKQSNSQTFSQSVTHSLKVFAAI